MICYYAHCMAIYKTPQESRDVDTLQALGFIVINPGTDDIERKCLAVKAEARAFNERLRARAVAGENVDDIDLVDPSQWVMSRIFKPLVQEESDVLAFRALPDGRIPVGVMQEITWAREADMVIFELPSGLAGRGMSINQTREYLAEAGQR